MCTMKIAIICILLSVVLAPSSGGPLDVILTNYFDNDGLGNYEFGFRTSDNIYRWQKGVLRYLGNQPYIDVTGGYAFVDDNNALKVTNFKANENGYQPEESEGPGGIPSRLAAGAG